MGTVYLIHLDRPYKHARHYLGFTSGGKRAALRRFKRHSNRMHYRRFWPTGSRTVAARC